MPSKYITITNTLAPSGPDLHSSASRFHCPEARVIGGVHGGSAVVNRGQEKKHKKTFYANVVEKNYRY